MGLPALLDFSFQVFKNLNRVWGNIKTLLRRRKNLVTYVKRKSNIIFIYLPYEARAVILHEKSVHPLLLYEYKLNTSINY